MSQARAILFCGQVRVDGANAGAYFPFYSTCSTSDRRLGHRVLQFLRTAKNSVLRFFGWRTVPRNNLRGGNSEQI